MNVRKRWTKDELLIILNVYEKLDFGKFHSRHPVIIDFAQKLGRTPASISMKLGNLGSLDHRLQARGIKGLTGASNLDREFWAEYQLAKEEHLLQSEELTSSLFSSSELDMVAISNEGISIERKSHETESIASTKVRLGQQFFRQTVLNAYGCKCGLTGFAARSMLVASHIIPWSESTDERLNVRNGIALNSLHDKAFDLGFITFDSQLKLVCSSTLSDIYSSRFAEQNFRDLEGSSLKLELNHLSPDPSYLEYHRDSVFKG